MLSRLPNKGSVSALDRTLASALSRSSCLSRRVSASAASRTFTSVANRTFAPASRSACHTCRLFSSSPMRWNRQRPPSEDGKSSPEEQQKLDKQEKKLDAEEKHVEEQETSKPDEAKNDTASDGRGPSSKDLPPELEELRKVVIVKVRMRQFMRAWLYSALGVGALGFAYYVTHLDTVPETGRVRFINLSADTEQKLATGIVSRILTANGLGRLRDQGLSGGTKAVRSVDDWSQPAGEEELWNPDLQSADQYQTSAIPNVEGAAGEWDLIVVNDKRFVNAYADIGLVVIGTGFLPICQTEQGLAAVLSHVARHRAENMSTSSLYWGVGAYTIAFFGLIGLLATLVPWGLGVFSEIPHSIGQEFEADIIGLKLMAKACYDPRASPEMLKRLAKIEEDVQKKLHRHEHLQTHPLAMERAKLLEPLLGKGYETMATNPDCADALSKFQEAAATLPAPN
ncbi:hypothetical protein BD626DRAFT_510339 [Schizophyllum amplum]|uniref:Peptidase M48 domain-containing protein n=1 Tax=Schizophyllum amplum TaxID=97359 RepID=A0A550C1N3_9AGAR|nr:hypothetical protein BD626DRAFT_510339 [Auriculariopsis ampla]